MTIDQPTATIAAATIAALGAVGTALINKLNWKPARKPKAKPGNDRRKILLKCLAIMIVSLGMFMESLIELVPYWSSEQVVTARIAIALMVRVLALVFFASGFCVGIGFLWGYFSGGDQKDQ
jgi:flagellar biosynthesis protein FlhB